MDNQTSTITLPETKTGAIWSATKVYTLGFICLLLGIAVGALARGAAPKHVDPAAPTAAASAQMPGMPGGAMQAPPADDPVFEQVKADPKNFDLLSQAGIAAMKARNPKLAIDYYQRALAVKDDPLVHTNLGNAYFRNGESDQALKEFASVLKSNPKDPNALYNSGVVTLMGKNDPKGAIQYWEEFLKDNPNHPQKGQVEDMLRRVKESMNKGKAS